MKRSRAVPLTRPYRRPEPAPLVPAARAATVSVAVLLTLTACASRERMTCADRGSMRAVPDSLCAPTRGAGGGAYRGSYGWYYGGSVGNAGGGARTPLVRGGGWSPRTGVEYRSPGGGWTHGPSGIARVSTSAARSSITRGGFGGIGAGRAGGG